MKTLFILPVLILVSLSQGAAQNLNSLALPPEIATARFINKVGEYTYYYKDLNTFYRADKSYNVVKTFTNSFPVNDKTYEKSVAVIGENHYIHFARYVKKEKRVELGYLSVENPQGIKIYISEPYKDDIYNLYTYYEVLNSPDNKRLFVLWVNALSSKLSYKLLEFNEKFELVNEYKIETNEIFNSEEIGRYEYCMGASTLHIVSPMRSNSEPMTVYTYSLSDKTLKAKAIPRPAGFTAFKPSFWRHYIDYDKKEDIMRFCFDVEEPSWNFFETNSVDPSAELAKVTSYNIATGKLNTVSVKFAADDVDSLKYAGNLKKEVKYAYKVGATTTYSMPGGMYAVLVEMINYVPHTFSGKTTELQSNNNVIMRIFDAEGRLIAGKSLYQKRGGDSYEAGIIGDKLWIFCNTYRRDDLDKEVVEGKHLLGCYTVNTDGKVEYTKYRVASTYPVFIEEDNKILFSDRETGENLYIDITK